MSDSPSGAEIQSALKKATYAKPAVFENTTTGNRVVCARRRIIEVSTPGRRIVEDLIFNRRGKPHGRTHFDITRLIIPENQGQARPNLAYFIIRTLNDEKLHERFSRHHAIMPKRWEYGEHDIQPTAKISFDELDELVYAAGQAAEEYGLSMVPADYAGVGMDFVVHYAISKAVQYRGRWNSYGRYHSVLVEPPDSARECLAAASTVRQILESNGLDPTLVVEAIHKRHLIHEA